MDETTAALMRATLGDRPPLPGAAVGGMASTPGIGIGRQPPLNNFHPHPAPGGMAGRRMKPGLKLSQMTGTSPTPNIGLGPGRPISPTNSTPRRPPPPGEFGTPFASFSKIV
jgi:mitogen-activated protein kinase kinase